MSKRDVHRGDFDRTEEIHANSFNYSLLKNVRLFEVTAGTRILENIGQHQQAETIVRDVDREGQPKSSRLVGVCWDGLLP